MPSPHLSTYLERVQVDGEPISEAEFAAGVEWLRAHMGGVLEQLGPPTEFEILTALAITYLARRCDRLVIEVGMGGRLDATNVLDLGIAVITNVSLDHVQHLGDTVEKIAVEKAGIIKAGNFVVSGAEPPAFAVIERRAREVGADLVRPRWQGRSLGWRGVEFDVSAPGLELKALRLPLLGGFQAANAALAVVTAAHLGVRDRESIQRGLSAARSPGRLEPFHGQPTVLLDGGHNPAALAELADAVLELREARRLIVVFGMMADKDIAAGLREVQRMRPDSVVFTAAESPRAASPADLSAAWGGSAEVVPQSASALRRAEELAGPEGIVLVCGSLYVVGEVRPLLLAARQ